MSNRRDFLRYSGAATLAAAAPAWSLVHDPLPSRPIPGTDQQMAIIGLGNSSAFRAGEYPLSLELLEAFLSRGGNYVDAGGASADFVGQLGREMGKTDQLFFGNYVDPGDAPMMREKVAGLARMQGKVTLDLVQTRDLDGFRTHHDVYDELKDDGLVRFIGVARSGVVNHEQIAGLIEDGLVDFIQVNYSMMEPQAADDLLPLAVEKNIGVAISRPFINGRYFALVEGRELPKWAAEFDCGSWAQFSLKYILSHPAVNCVLTETADPVHLIDNLSAGFGRLPDEGMRDRMFDYMQAIMNSQ